MLTKLDMIDTQVVLMNSIEWCHDDVINDDTAGQFRLELSIFRTFGYNNLISLRLMFIKLDMIDKQVVLTELIEWRHQLRHTWPVSARTKYISNLWVQ